MSWPMVKLVDVVTLNPRAPKELDSAQIVSFVGMASVSEDGQLLSEEPRVLEETKKGFTYFAKSDVLLAKITPCFENGKCLRANQISNPVGFGSTEFHVLRPDESKLDATYLFYMIWSNQFRTLGAASMFGAAGQKRVGSDFLKNFEIPLPPLAEQKRIAAILDKSDAIRCKRQQAIQLAEDFLRAVFLEMFGDPVTNPKGWEVKPIGSFCTLQGGYAFKSDEFCEDGIPLLKITNVHFEDAIWDDISYLPKEKLSEKSNFALECGDLVMAMTRPVIQSLSSVKIIEIKESDIPSLLNQRVGRFKGYSKVLNKNYLKYFLYSDFFRTEVEKLCSVALQPNVSSKQIESIKCCIPDLHAQEEFSRTVEIVSRMQAKLHSFSKNNMLDALSHKAFSGQL